MTIAIHTCHVGHPMQHCVARPRSFEDDTTVDVFHEDDHV